MTRVSFPWTSGGSIAGNERRSLPSVPRAWVRLSLRIRPLLEEAWILQVLLLPEAFAPLRSVLPLFLKNLGMGKGSENLEAKDFLARDLLERREFSQLTKLQKARFESFVLLDAICCDNEGFGVPSLKLTRERFSLILSLDRKIGLRLAFSLSFLAFFFFPVGEILSPSSSSTGAV